MSAKDTTYQRGPWKIISRSGGCCRIGTDESNTIATVGGHGDRQSFEDARRIVCCVNACDGLAAIEIQRAVKAWRERGPVSCRIKRRVEAKHG